MLRSCCLVLQYLTNENKGWHDATGLHVTRAAWQGATPQKLISRDVMWFGMIKLNYFTHRLEFLLLLFHGRVCLSLLTNLRVFFFKLRWMRIRESWNPKSFRSRRNSLLFEKRIEPQQRLDLCLSRFLPSLMKSVPFLEYLKTQNEKRMTEMNDAFLPT